MNDAEVGGMQAQLSRLATKSDLCDAKNSIIRWAVGTAISAVTLTFMIALLVSACAPVRDPPTLAAQAARYGVSPSLLRTAENRGFRPQIRDDKTMFCHASEVTGSYIAGQECLDVAQLQTRLARDADEQRQSQEALQQSHGACSPTASGC
jgi:hypothetical protein